MLTDGGTTDEQRVAWTFRLMTGRHAKVSEITVLNQLLDEQRSIFRADVDAAKRLLAVGESKHDPSLDPVELAAGTVLAQAIMNHDEAVMKR